MSVSARFKARTVPTVVISEQAMEDMMHITRLVNTEVGWLGFATHIGQDNVGRDIYRVSEVYLPHQEVHGATVEMQPEHLEKAMLEIIDTLGGEKYDQLRVWGHSHVNMGTSPSGQDDTTLDWLADSVSDFFIAIRTNKSGSVQVDVGYPHTWSYVNVPHRLEGAQSERLDMWRGLVDERVKPLVSKVIPKTTSNVQSHQKPYQKGGDQFSKAGAAPSRPPQIQVKA